MVNHDLEEILPIQLIREHTKTDDTPSVTDAQLALYRQDSFEVAEQYTGRSWTGFKEYIQNIGVLPKPRRGKHIIKLEKGPVDGKVTLYGGPLPHPQVIHSRPGVTLIEVPEIHCYIPFNDCCRGDCEGGGYSGVRAFYNVGVANPKDVPAGIIMGCLKLIAWNINNAGDVIMTTRNVQAFSNSGALQGTNNGAWASGAIEQWRMFR